MLGIGTQLAGTAGLTLLVADYTMGRADQHGAVPVCRVVGCCGEGGLVM